MLAAVCQNSSSNDNQGQEQLLGYCVWSKEKKDKSASGNFVFSGKKL